MCLASNSTMLAGVNALTKHSSRCQCLQGASYYFQSLTRSTAAACVFKSVCVVIWPAPVTHICHRR